MPPIPGAGGVAEEDQDFQATLFLASQDVLETLLHYNGCRLDWYDPFDWWYILASQDVRSRSDLSQSVSNALQWLADLTDKTLDWWYILKTWLLRILMEMNKIYKEDEEDVFKR